MDFTEHLLTTKIQVPPLPTKNVRRGRLLEALDRGLHPNSHLTLISAPAGYGKTTLFSTWIHDRDLPVAWYSIDEGDNDPIRFSAYLLSTLKNGNPDISLSPSSIEQFSEDEFQVQLLIPLLNQISQSPRQTLLFLDDYHWIQSQTIHDRVGYLLENLPPQAHIFIATRSDPALPITRLRGRGQVNELRLEDLRFRAKEVESFLGIFSNLDLSSEDIKILTDRSEGWISSLQMAAVSLQSHEDKGSFIRSFSGSHHYIMDYLLDEVIRQQSPEVQTFLLNTSILKRMCGSLCDALMELVSDAPTPSQKILTELERANLFIIALDDRRQWYRYHRLFSDLLQSRLQPADPDHIPALHRVASQWFEENGFMDDAVHHALLVHDPVFAADLIERSSQATFMRSETMTFLRWVQRLPEKEIQRRPKLWIYRAWSLLFQGAPLSTIEAQLEKDDEISGPPGSALVLKAYISLSKGQLEKGIDFAERALERLPRDEIVLRDFATFCVSASLISLGERERGIKLFQKTSQRSHQAGNKMLAVLLLCKLAEYRTRQLQYKEAQDLYQKALTMATDEQGTYLPIAGVALIGLGNLALEQFELEEAERLLQEGIQYARRWNIISTLGGYLSIALLQEAKGEPEKLTATLEILHDLARRFDASEFDDLAVEIVELGIKARSGDFTSFHRWVSEWEREDAPAQKIKPGLKDYLSPRLYKYQLPILIRLQIEGQNYDEALTLVDRLCAEAEQADRPYLQAEAEILRALTFHKKGEPASSLTALQRALEIALPQKATRIFLVEGKELIQLLKIARSNWTTREYISFIDSILGKVESPPLKETPLAQDLSEPLSPRELEILRLLPSGLTAEELADELIISVNTVRSHLKNIYAKLGVHSRHEAVARANDLDLL